MRLGYELTIEQTQKLSMTPEMVQAIQILQMNQQDLIEYVENELLENPVLEIEKNGVSTQIDIQADILSAEADDWRCRQWKIALSDDESLTLEQFVSEEQSLEDYLMEQLHLSDFDETQMTIGRYIIEAIDDNGYLTLSVEEIARDCGFSADNVTSALTLIQAFDPPGVAARSLQECLLLQLTEKGLLTEEIEYLITHMLEDLAAHRFGVIGKQLNMTSKEIQQLADLIKCLEPKPGRAFSSKEATGYVTPDVLVEKVDGEYMATYDDSTVPGLRISSYYQHLKRAYQDEELQKYLSERINSALWLIKNIEQRKQTIHKVANAIVSHQWEFFESGEQHLKPLTLHQIAEKLQLHESTVSRTVNGKYLQCTRGIFALKYFFSGGVEGEDGQAVSSNSIKAIIRELIAVEDPKKPYSDQQLVVLLAAKGIPLSRRTIAKYRESMHILSSPKRRRF